MPCKTGAVILFQQKYASPFCSLISIQLTISTFSCLTCCKNTVQKCKATWISLLTRKQIWASQDDFFTIIAQQHEPIVLVFSSKARFKLPCIFEQYFCNMSDMKMSRLSWNPILMVIFWKKVIHFDSKKPHRCNG
jgi:hypothetical protein